MAIGEREGFREQITRRAYELYEQRGGEPGHEQEDWLEAERQVRAATPAEGSAAEAKEAVPARAAEAGEPARSKRKGSAS